MGTVVRASPQLQLIAAGGLGGGEHGLYACARRARRARWLTDQDYLPGPQVLAGNFVVYERLSCNREVTVCGGSMLVYDGARNRTRKAITARQPNGVIQEALGPLVNARGAAAWLRPISDGLIEVWVWPRTGRPRVVSSGTDIDTSSLASSGGTLYWLAGGLARSAPLR